MIEIHKKRQKYLISILSKKKLLVSETRDKIFLLFPLNWMWFNDISGLESNILFYNKNVKSLYTFWRFAPEELPKVTKKSSIEAKYKALRRDLNYAITIFLTENSNYLKFKLKINIYD